MKYRFIDLKPSGGSFLEAVLEGLAKPQKTLPAKFFYNERGSKLFEDITNLPEYYPTRTEKKLLAEIGPTLSRLVPKGAKLVEFGAGSTEKVRLLIDAVGNFDTYIPIDISRDYLEAEAEDLAQDHPKLAILAICADYTRLVKLPVDIDAGAGCVGFFPGSTIGNMTPDEAERFLRHIGALLGPGAGLIIGADLQKDPAILYAAYNDKKGVTAAFNLNVLRRINQELEGNFDLASFRHKAFYNPVPGRIEMHLESLRDQTVQIGGRDIAFARGETIHTENSYKFTRQSFEALAKKAGFKPLHYWQDGDALFSIHYLEVQTAP